MSTIPSEEECIRLLKEAGAADRVIKHVCTVTAVASAIADRCPADRELVRAGALLHDIGRSKGHGDKHSAVGAEMARELGLPEAIVSIVRKHMGAGFTGEEAEEMGLPPGDYMPSTLEEKIVCHADNMVADDRIMSIRESIGEARRKGYRNTADRMAAMHSELSSACGEDVDLIVSRVDPSKHQGPCAKHLRMKINKWMG